MRKRALIEYIQENHDNLTESQKKLATYVIDNYNEIGFLSALELGERVGLSDATIIRFARTLGFKGFSEFKDSVRENIKEMDSPDLRLLKNWGELEDKSSVIAKISKNDLNNLQYFIMNLDMDKVERTVDEIYKAKTIYFCGLESSASVIDFLVLHMRRMGFNVMSISEGGNLNVERISNISKDDMLIVSSFPRYSKSTYQSICFAKKKNAKVMALTDNNFSKVALASDIVHVIRIENSTFFNSHISTLEFCNVLLMSIFERNKDKIYKNLKEHTRNMEIYDLNVD